MTISTKRKNSMPLTELTCTELNKVAGGRANSGAGSDTLLGTRGNDIVLGKAGSNFLSGSTGNDTIRGAGNDDQ